MTLAIIGLIAALASVGVLAPSFGKVGEISQGKGSNKVSEFFSSAGDSLKSGLAKLWLKVAGLFHKKQDDSQTSDADAARISDWIVNPYEGTSRGEAPSEGNYSGMNVPSGTSAQASVVTNPDAGSVAGHIEDSQNGGSAATIDDSVEWIKKILAALGMSSLFGNGDDEHQWESYKDIVDDERKYGEGAINDARRWQEYMSSTAYQRTIKDIEAAGLNPWLAVQSGSLSPTSWGSVDTGSALGSISTSLSQSLTNSNSNSSSAIIVALIMMLAKVFMS